MSFEQIIQDCSCHCTAGSQEDYHNLYIKKVDGPELRDKDFVTKWEKSHRPQDMNDCKAVCGYKGVSVNIVNNEQDIIETVQVYKTTLSIQPKGKSKYVVFRFKIDSGVVKSTPNAHSNTHCDFYKCDQFALSSIAVQDTQPII